MEGEPTTNAEYRKMELEHLYVSLVMVKQEFFRRYGYSPTCLSE